MSRAPAQPNKSLIDGLAVMQAVAVSREPVACSDVARRLGLELTRVNRLLKTLAFLGVVYQTRDRKYAAGPGMHVLAAQSLFASGLVQRAVGPLEQLSRLRLIVAMGVLWRDSVSYLYYWRPGLGTAEALGRTALYPATRSGIGMALLAACDVRKTREVYEGRRIPGFPDVTALGAELRMVREQGYAVVPTPGGTTVGVCFGTPPYAAVALAGPDGKVDTETRVAALRETVAEIEGGGQGGPPHSRK